MNNLTAIETLKKIKGDIEHYKSLIEEYSSKGIAKKAETEKVKTEIEAIDIAIKALEEKTNAFLENNFKTCLFIETIEKLTDLIPDYAENHKNYDQLFDELTLRHLQVQINPFKFSKRKQIKLFKLFQKGYKKCFKDGFKEAKHNKSKIIKCDK